MRISDTIKFIIFILCLTIMYLSIVKISKSYFLKDTAHKIEVNLQDNSIYQNLEEE